MTVFVTHCGPDLGEAKGLHSSPVTAGDSVGSQDLPCCGVNCVPEDACVDGLFPRTFGMGVYLESVPLKWRLSCNGVGVGPGTGSSLNTIFRRPGDRNTGYLGARRDFHKKRNQEGHHRQERDRFTPSPTGTSTDFRLLRL